MMAVTRTILPSCANLCLSDFRRPFATFQASEFAGITESVYRAKPDIGQEEVMSVRISVGALAVVALILWANTDSRAQSGGAEANKASTPAQAQVAGNTADSQDSITAMRADLDKMRQLLMQMRSNAAFAANVTSPIYHQFELENAMWQLEVDILQRQVDALERANKTTK